MFDNAPVVKLTNAAIMQADKTVLSNVSFEIEKGEMVYMIGRTGSGKSSLLKTLYADLKPGAGTFKVVGFDLKTIKPREVPDLRRRLGIVFQDFQLLTDRNVAENLLFVMRATGWRDRSKMRNRMAEVLMRVGLSAADRKMPHQLSGGEQQRVVIARALLNEPRILLADEPTGNLDPEVAEEIIDLFHKINSSGTAILMATHNHGFLTKFPARALDCTNGQITDTGRTEQG